MDTTTYDEFLLYLASIDKLLLSKMNEPINTSTEIKFIETIYKNKLHYTDCTYRLIEKRQADINRST